MIYDPADVRICVKQAPALMGGGGGGGVVTDHTPGTPTELNLRRKPVFIREIRSHCEQTFGGGNWVTQRLENQLL